MQRPTKIIIEEQTHIKGQQEQNRTELIRRHLQTIVRLNRERLRHRTIIALVRRVQRNQRITVVLMKGVVLRVRQIQVVVLRADLHTVRVLRQEVRVRRAAVHLAVQVHQAVVQEVRAHLADSI